jgi:type I restriction enzyme S subunit
MSSAPHTITQKPLPSEWRWVKIGHVVKEAIAGFACGQREDAGIIQIRMQNLNTVGSFVWDNLVRIPLDCHPTDHYLLKKNDVLFNNTNSTELVGKSALFDCYKEPVVFSNHYTRFRTDSKQLEPGYLAYWLVHLWQQGVFAAICNRWIGQSAIKNDKLLKLEIPLPPLPEQQRIACVLKEHMAAVVKARVAAEARLAAVKALPTAFLREVFPLPGQPLPNGWRWFKLAELCEVRLGKMLSPASKTGCRSIPYLRNANVQWNRFDLASVNEMDFSEEQEAVLSLKPGDVLVCEGGEPGRAAIWAGQISRCCYQKTLHRLRPIDNAIDPHFIMYRLWRGALDAEFSGSNAQTTIAHLPLGRMKNLNLAIPSIAEQHRIGDILKAQMATAEQARSAAEAELAAINALPAALLRRAFSGGL